MNRRVERVNDLIRDELSELLLREVRDPRLDRLITFTHVDVTPDFYTARVSVSVLGTPEEQDEALKALNSAASFFHRELKSRLDIRRVPFLQFKKDTSIEEGARVLALLEREHLEPEAAPKPATSDE